MEEFGGVPAGRHNVSRHSVGTVEGVGLGVVRGSCKSVVVEGLSIADSTVISTEKATTYDNDNDNNDETARRATLNAGHVDCLPSVVVCHKDLVSEPKCRLSRPF